MGPSGSGKTTLLDVLAGRKTVGTISGSVSIAGRRPTREFLRRHVGYVEQFGASASKLTHCVAWGAQDAAHGLDPTCRFSAVLTARVDVKVTVALLLALRGVRVRMQTWAIYVPHPRRLMVRADTLLANLTVFEMLLYTAEMRNKVSLSAHAKREHVEAVLSALGLQLCRDVLIGDPLHRGVSGMLWKPMSLPAIQPKQASVCPAD